MANQESSENERSQPQPESEADKTKELSPLYLFLASSLNFELVYSILKGITQFSYITLADPELAKPKLAKMQIEKTQDDTQLTLFEIKVKNTRHWGAASYQQFMHSDLTNAPKVAANEANADLLVLKQQVKITFHMIDHFKKLYALWGINNFADFYNSLSPKYNRDMIFKAGEGAGRSGSFFFFSHDQKFVVKTMTATELALIKKIMPQYKAHMTKNTSMLSKILGLFTIKAASFSTVHVMLMENTLRLKDPQQLKYVFDLKGSMVNRTVKGKTKPTTTLKDVNFLLTKKKLSALTRLDERTSRRLIKTMRGDVAFLSSLNLMDYSLLIAIERTNTKKSQLHFDPSEFDEIQANHGFNTVLLQPAQHQLVRDPAESQTSTLTDARRKNIGEWMSEQHRF